MNIITHIITQSGHKLSIDTGSLIINKLESLNHKIRFVTDSESDGYKYFLMLNPKTGKYISYPLDTNNEIIITTAITAYAGKWSALLIACENEMVSNDIDNKQYTYVSNVLPNRIVIKDNFIEDENATEVDIPIYLELIQKFSEIQSNIENISASVDSIYQNTQDIQTDINTTKDNIIEMQENISVMESSVNSTKNDVLDSESRVSTFVDDANEIKNAVSQIYDNAQITKSDINLIVTEINAIKSNVDTSEQNVESMVADVTELKNETLSMKEDVSEMKDAVNAVATEVNAKSLTVEVNTNGILNFIYK